MRDGHIRTNGIPGTAWQETEQDYCLDNASLVVSYSSDVLDHQTFHEIRVPEGCHIKVRQSDGNRPFYTYYQISGADESDETETEPKKEGELRTEYESSHSPFGFIWQIASATGWSVDYILNGINYQTLIMMLSDAPRFVRRKAGSDPSLSEEDEASSIVGFFQSKLKI